jgi:tripartite-type tricarboxylate transporter receptor subunit TctC
MSRALLLVLVLLPGLALAQAQSFPSRPVRIIVGFAAGGPSDIVARLIAQQLGEKFARPFLVENRPGATGTIGAELVAKSKPDGHTLYLASQTTHAVTPYMYQKVGYDPVKDFATVTLAMQNPLLVVVHPSLGVKSVKELVALARARPNQLSFASGGVGSGGHLSGELLKYMTKIDMLHVPYKGNSVALADVLGGHVTLMFDTITTGIPHAQKGKLRLLAVTSAERAPQAPDAPTMQEAGLRGYETDAWYALLAPPKVSPAVQQQLNAELNKAFKDPAFREQFVAQGVRFVGGTPEQLEAHMRAETERWSKVFAAMGVKPQ